jgi:hypothetical protein
VFWPLIAANATFALNAGVWFRRARLLIVSPDSSGTACPLSGRNSTYPPVQISGAGSRFFAEITRNRIRRGVFKSVPDLKTAIMEYLENHNANPKPFIWTKSAGEILEKVARAKQALESQH